MADQRRAWVSADFSVERHIVRQPTLDGFRREQLTIEVAKNTVAARFFDEVKTQLQMIACLFRGNVVRRNSVKRKRTRRAIYIEAHIDERHPAWNARHAELLQQSAKRHVLMLLCIQDERVRGR